MPEAGGQGSMGGDEASEARRQTGVRVVWPALWNGWKRGRGDEQTETSSLQGCHPVGCLRSEASPAGVKVPSVRSHSRSEPGGRKRQESGVERSGEMPAAGSSSEDPSVVGAEPRDHPAWLPARPMPRPAAHQRAGWG